MTVFDSGPGRGFWRRWIVLSALLLGLVGLLSLTYPVEELSRRAGDLYFRLRESAPSSGQVALVLIDDGSLSRYGRWPWSRSLIARLVRAASAQHPQVIGVDILLAEAQDTNNDRELAAAIREAGNVVLPAKISGTPAGAPWVEPLSELASASAGIGHVQVETGPDGICRRIPVIEMTLRGPRPAFALEVERVARGLTRPAPAADSPGTLIAPLQFLIVDYRGQIMPGESPFTVISAAELLDGNAGGSLKGKAVLIGFASTEITDRLATPISSQLPMPGVEVQANLLDARLAGRNLRPLPSVLEAVLVTGATLVLTWMLLLWPGWIGLAASGGLALTSYAGGYALFVYGQRLVAFGPFLALMVLAPPLVQLQSLIAVDRRLTRSLAHLRDTLAAASSRVDLRSAIDTQAAGGNLHWKIATISKLECELSALYAFCQTLLDGMHQGLAVFTVDGRPAFRNATWNASCQGLGLAVNASLDALVAAVGQPGWRDSIKDSWHKGLSLEAEVLREQGLWNVRLARLPATSLAGSGALMVIVTDLTARLERDRARAEALGFVTHELRTPLVSIQGFAEFLLRYPGAPGGNEAADTIFRESRRLVAMINGYLDILRLESGAAPMCRRRVDVEATVKQVELVMRPLAVAAEKTIKLEIDEHLPAIQGDAQLLGGALLNLVSNAVKYGSPGSVIRIEVKPAHQGVEFDVVNAAPVIPASELAQLFEPFYRRANGELSVRGWGLGLAFVKRIAEAHGGSVGATSDDDGGTRFRIVIPAESVEAAEVVS